MNDKLIINGCVLERTCYACPEQYDVYFQGFLIGYLRLRHGCFRAEYPDVGGTTVFTAYPKGDGIFDADERMPFLTTAINALLAEHNKQVISKIDSVVD